MAKTLLLADDSVTIQRVVELTFAHEDIHVVSMSDGQRALSWLDAERPDIVLVDVAVPEVDGYELAAHVKKSSRLKHVPVLLLAGAFEPVDEARSRSIGCDGVIIKPFEPKQLVERVKELLREGGGKSARGGRDRGKDEKARGGDRSGPAEGGPRPVPASDPLFAGSMGGAAAATDDEPQPLELPKPLWGEPAPAARADAPPHAPPKVSLVNAFSALLAAEKSVAPAPQAPAAAAAPVSDAAIEEAVRRVLSRMTGDMVRRIVHDTAERLIREEIEKIKAAVED